MCNKIVRSRKTGTSAPCPVKGLHEYEGKLYCLRHYKQLTKVKAKPAEPKGPSKPPELQNIPVPELNPIEEAVVIESEEELPSAEEDELVTELSSHQRAILNKVAATEDEPTEEPKKKRVRVAEDREIPPPKKGSILETQKGLFALCAFAGLEILEGVVSEHFVDIKGTIQEVRNISEAREALDELLESLVPDDILEAQADPFTRLITIIFLVAINKYRENTAVKVLSNPELKDQLDAFIKQQELAATTTTATTQTKSEPPVPSHTDRHT
jgi:hypothetical protein